MLNRPISSGWTWLILLPWLGLVARGADLKPQFDRDIVPLFKERCVKCHGPSKQEGELNLSTAIGVARGGESGLAIEPANLAGSLIWARVSEYDMPPDDPPLSNEELELLRLWIAQGAAGLPTQDELGDIQAEHWAFQALHSIQVPTVLNEETCRTDLDRFLQAKLESHGLSLGPEADRSAQIRRVSIALTGLPPTIKELSAYLSDPSENAYQRMVEGYLSSPRYGERWGKHWLDVAGYAESNGYFDSDSERPLAYRYRDYVIRSINGDKPYDQFIQEQIAGDELAEALGASGHSPRVVELMEATHFLLNAQDGTGESDGNPEEVLLDRRAVLDSTVEIMGSAFFGLTLQCAKCHDHKFEPITQRDYYGLQAVLAPAFDLDNWVTPAERYVEVADPKETAAFEIKLRQGTAVETERPGKIAAVKDVSAVPPNVFVLLRGEYKLPGEQVFPSGPAVLTDPDTGLNVRPPRPGSQSTGYRLAFAQWLTQPNSRPAALLARAHVNRIWQNYFERGLVATPANLGISGDAPTHPELLEWLTAQFVQSGWSTKAVHRLIVNSNAYRQSSAFNPGAHAIDPENRLLWRMPLRRLDAEAIYDGLLAIGGDLDLRMGGPSTTAVRIDVGEILVPEATEGRRRRAVYIQQRRTQVPTLLGVFDAPALVTNCVQRTASTMPLQSLTLLNSDFMLARAEKLAKRIALDAGLESDARIVRAFQLILARDPDGEEIRASLQFVRGQTRHYQPSSPVPQRRAWADLCHSLMISNAFLYLD